MYQLPTCREMALEDRPNFIEAVVTCEGNLHDPDFSTKFQIIVGKLKSLLSPSSSPREKENLLHVRKIEPWNSVRVTISIPKEAAQRLKNLAEQGSTVLRQLGILSVQVEGDQVISLTLAGSNNEPTHVTLQHETPNSSQSFPSSSASAVGNFLMSNPSLQQKQTPSSSIPFAVAGPSGVRFAPDGRNSVQQGSPFRSPNVVAPTGDGIPNYSQKPTGPGMPPRIPLAGPFPFQSMVHAAAHNVQRSDPNSVQGASDNPSSSVSNITNNNSGNVYVLGKSTNVQNHSSQQQQFHNLQQSTPVTGVLLTSQSGVGESVGTKFVFSNSNLQSSGINAISQANSTSASSVQPGANPSLQIQLVNVANSTLPPPPYPYNQQKQQPPATLQIRQQQPPPQVASQIAAAGDKPMSSPLLVNLLQHGDTGSGGNNNAASNNPGLQRSQSMSAMPGPKSQEQMSMPPPPMSMTSGLDNQQLQYYRRQQQVQDQRTKRSLSLESGDTQQRLQEPNVFHDSSFTASQSTSAITYSSSSTSSPMPNSNSNSEHFQFAMPLPCDVPSSSRNSAEQQLRTSTITQNSMPAPQSQNSTAYRINPTEVIAFHQQQQQQQQQQQHNQLQQQPQMRFQHQQQQGHTMLQPHPQSGYQKMQQNAPGPSDPNGSLSQQQSVHLQNQQQHQQQIRGQHPQHLLNGPVSSQQQYSSHPQTIAQSGSNVPSYVNHPGNNLYGTSVPTSQANIATAVHVTKIPVQQAISTLNDQQQQIHSFVPLSAVNVPSVSNANAVPGHGSYSQSPTTSHGDTGSGGQPMSQPQDNTNTNTGEASTKNFASQPLKSSVRPPFVPSMPTSVTSIRTRAQSQLPGARMPHAGVGGGKPRLLLNPLTGHLEPKAMSGGSSDSDEDTARSGKKSGTGKRGLGKGKPAEALAPGMASKFGKQPTTISEQAKELQKQIMLLQQQEQLLLQQQHRLHQPPTPSTNSSTGATTTSTPTGKKVPLSEEGKHDALNSSGEKIKLRLKLEKNEPVLSPAYKVDVKFLKAEEKATTGAAAPTVASASVSGQGCSAPADQPRVPPLHISLRGKNAAVVVSPFSPRRDERDHPESVPGTKTAAESSALTSDIVKSSIAGSNCVDAVVAAVSAGSGTVKNRAKSRLKSADIPNQNKAKVSRPKNFLPDASPQSLLDKSVPGKLRAKKSASFSSTNLKAELADGKFDLNSQSKKEKKSRRKSEHSEFGKTSTKVEEIETGSHDVLDYNLEEEIVPKMEDSQLLQLLSDNVTTPKIENIETKTVSSKIAENSHEDAIMEELPSSEVSGKASKNQESISADNLTFPVQNHTDSENSDKKPHETLVSKPEDEDNGMSQPSEISLDAPKVEPMLVDKDEYNMLDVQASSTAPEMTNSHDEKDSAALTAQFEEKTDPVPLPEKIVDNPPQPPPVTETQPATSEAPEKPAVLESNQPVTASAGFGGDSQKVISISDYVQAKKSVPTDMNAVGQYTGTKDKILEHIARPKVEVLTNLAQLPQTTLPEEVSMKSLSATAPQITKSHEPSIPKPLMATDIKKLDGQISDQAFVYTSTSDRPLPVDGLLHNKPNALPSSSHSLVSRIVTGKPIVEASSGNGNGNGNGTGEDSGIDSMDALSEKSPNQGESPVRKELEQHHVHNDRSYLPSSMSQPIESEKYSAGPPEPSSSKNKSQQEESMEIVPDPITSPELDKTRNELPEASLSITPKESAESISPGESEQNTHLKSDAIPGKDRSLKSHSSTDSFTENVVTPDENSEIVKLEITPDVTATEQTEKLESLLEIMEENAVEKTEESLGAQERESQEETRDKSVNESVPDEIPAIVKPKASTKNLISPDSDDTSKGIDSSESTSVADIKLEQIEEQTQVKVEKVDSVAVTKENASKCDKKPQLVSEKIDEQATRENLAAVAVSVNEEKVNCMSPVHTKAGEIKSEKMEVEPVKPVDIISTPVPEIDQISLESSKEKEEPKPEIQTEITQKSALDKAEVEEPREVAKAQVPTVSSPEIKPAPKIPCATEVPSGQMPVSFLPRIDTTLLRQRPLLRPAQGPHTQNPPILLRPNLLDSSARFAVGVRPDLKALPRLQPKPEEKTNHEPIQVSKASDTEGPPPPNIDLQPLPISFSRSSGLPNVIQLTRAPSGAITTVQSKVAVSSSMSPSTMGNVIQVSLPQGAHPGKSNSPRPTLYAIHPNSSTMIPQQLHQQQQTVTLASGHKVVPIKLVTFPRHTQGIGSFVGAPLNRSSPTLIEAGTFRNVSSGAQMQSAVQMGMPGNGNITLVPISAVPTNVGHIPGQHNPVKLLVSSPLKVQQNLRQQVVVKSVVMGAANSSPNIPRGATAIKVVAPAPLNANHAAVNDTACPIPSVSESSDPPPRKEDKPENAKESIPTSAVAKKVEKTQGPVSKPKEEKKSIYKGIHGVELLDTSLADSKNQEFVFRADIIHDEKDLAAILASESVEIVENGIEDSSSSAYDFTHNDYDVLPPQPIKSAIRQASEAKGASRSSESPVPGENATNDEEPEASESTPAPNSPVRLLRSNSPLYTYSNRVSSARNSDRSSSRSPSPAQDLDGEDQEIIDSFSSSESLSKDNDTYAVEKFPDHSYNQAHSNQDRKHELGPLSINTECAEYGHTDGNEMEKKGKRNTRSSARAPSPDITEFSSIRAEAQKAPKKSELMFKNSPKASPTGSLKLLSPTAGGGSGASSARASPISNSASSTASSSHRMLKGPNRRKRQGSESSSASKEEGLTEDKMELIDLNSRPGKRRCSENAAELIKACIGIEDNPKRVNSYNRKLEDAKSRDRARRNTPTILEQNEGETDSLDFSLLGRSGSRGSSEDRSSSRGSSVQRSSLKSAAREEDGFDKASKKKETTRKLKTPSESETSNNAHQKDEVSKARRSKRGAPGKSVLGSATGKNVQTQDTAESTVTTGAKSERRKTRSSAAVGDKGGSTAKRRRISKETKS